MIRTSSDKWNPNSRKLDLYALPLVLILTILTLPCIASENNHDKQHILFLHSYNEFLPWNIEFTKGLTAALKKQNNNLEIYREYLDVYRLGGENRANNLINSLKTKYQNINIDSVIGESEEAVQFIVDYGETIFPKASQILFTSHDISRRDRRLVITPKFSQIVENTVKFALAQNPTADKALIIDGGGPENLTEVTAIQQTISRYANKGIDIEVIKNFSITELLAQVQMKTQDQKSLVFYTLIFKDRLGERFIPKDVLQNIAAISKAPVYANYSTLIGSGVIGGQMLDSFTLAESSLTAAIDYHRQGEFRSEGYPTSRAIFDWQAMAEHNIKESLLPTHAFLVNKPSSFFERYYLQLVAFLFTVLSLLVTSLFFTSWLSKKNKKLLQINEELSNTQSKLEASNLALNEMAMVDYLTQLLNRRAMLMLIDDANQQGAQSNFLNSLILLDIDNFKRINDSYGHHVGDAVLIEIADLLKKSVRKSDTIARWGGEEFLILTTVSELEEAVSLAMKLTHLIGSHDFNCLNKKITVSVGVSAMKPNHSFEDSFQCVDKALYEAKNSGKNIVKVNRD